MPVEAIGTLTHPTLDRRQALTDGNLCGFGILEKFSYLYVTIDGYADPMRHVQLYRIGLGTMLPDGCQAGDTYYYEAEGNPDQKAGTRIPETL